MVPASAPVSGPASQASQPASGQHLAGSPVCCALSAEAARERLRLHSRPSLFPDAGADTGPIEMLAIEMLAIAGHRGVDVAMDSRTP